MAELGRFREVGRVRRFRDLLLAQMAGQAGDGLAQISFAQLVLFEAGRGATPGALAALLAVTLLPFSLVGPFAGALIDRFDRRRVLVTTSLVRIGIVVSALPILAARAEIPAYVAVLGLLSTSRFVLAAKGAALPRTIGAELLVPANALSAIAGMVVGFVGAVAGSLFVHRAPAAGFIIAAALYGGAAIMWSRLHALGGGHRPVPARLVRQAVGEVVAGARFVARASAVRGPLLAVAAHRTLLGAGFVVLVLLADQRYELEAPGYGLALAATGIGAFVGNIVAPRLARGHDPAKLLPAAFPVAAAAALVGGFFPSLPVLVTALGVAACAFQALKVLVDAVVQLGSPDEVRGRVFAAYDVAYNVAFVVAALALVPLWRPDRDHMLLWGVAVGFFAAALLMASERLTWPFGRAARSDTPVAKRWRWRVGAMLVAAPVALIFPEPSWSLLAWVGLVPVFLIVRAAPTVREAGWRAWAGGAGFVMAAQHWLVPTAGPGVALLGIVLGVAWVPCGWLVSGLLAGRPSTPRALAACALVPAAWTAAEFLRSWEALGGPWALLGASQWNQRHGALALASLGGVWLVSFALVCGNVAVTALVAARRSPCALLALGLVLVTVIAAGPVWALLRPQPVPWRTLRVLGVQPGITEGPTARFNASEAATLSRAGERPDLVVWGESSVGFDFGRRPDLLARVVALARVTGADVLVNVDARRPSGGIFKSAVLVGRDGVRGRYDKMRLVPFGEYIPLRWGLGWLARFTRAAQEDRGRGSELVLMEVAGVRLGPLVCFEVSFPDLTRRLTADGADLIVVQSATSTFQESWAPEQHASLAALRAVETGRPVLHATLTGVSAAFDAAGRELLWFGTEGRGAYDVALPLVRGDTPYVRVGDWLPAAAFSALLLAAATMMVGTARRAAPDRLAQ